MSEEEARERGPEPALPEPFAAWIGEALGRVPARESAAPCEDCAMCRAPDPPASVPALLFDPGTKCCTYLPEIPNFLAGRILRDPSPANREGAATLRARLAAGEAVTPLGVLQTEWFRARYRPDGPTFGREPELRCPHFAPGSGRCTIWPYRESACSTWSCKHDRGARGKAVRDALRALLQEIEWSLARWAARESGAGDEDFGRWSGRAEALYVACAARVDPLGWPEVRAIAGDGLRGPLGAAAAALARLEDPVLPERLLPGDFQEAGRSPTGHRVVAYSPFDPLELPHPLPAALRRFDGRPNEVVLAELEERLGLRLRAGALRTLVDHGMLVPAPAPDPGAGCPGGPDRLQSTHSGNPPPPFRKRTEEPR